MARHTCPNRFSGEGAKGGCFFTIEEADKKDGGGDPMIRIEVGWSCVVVAGGLGRDAVIPISWLSELIAVATSHNDGIAGFLEEQCYGGGESYALMCDPP